ncbi:protein phosphatase 2C domain-containing protein [Luedemannella helvata]|uniref:PPM-type phosphatase domain-containing protein n=1 Tax=Luedemannella helvata TaxID=349315 RepID=A0ABP4X2G9_9ACTN
MPSPSTWQVHTASALGAQHVAMGKGNEDAVAVRQPDPDTVAVAVADGHGHARHFRSERGSALAVEVATELGATVGAGIPAGATAEHIERMLRERTGPDLVRAWLAAVDRDLAARPVGADELHAAGLTKPSPDELVFGYGATLILAVVSAGWLLCAQIGDGDVLAVTEDGRVLRPVPADPRLDGSRTTSLCQPDAADALRYGVVSLAGASIAAVMLATDGYGNAQARNDWDTAFGTDLAALAAAHGPAWLGRQLPRWVGQCASSDGSADDVTVALVLASAAGWRPALPANPDRTTVVDANLPAGGGTIVMNDHTVPNVPPPGRPVVIDDATVLTPGRRQIGDDTTVLQSPRRPGGDDTTVVHSAYGASPAAPLAAPPVTSPPAVVPPVTSPPPLPYAAPPARSGPLSGSTRETVLLVALAALAAVAAVVFVVLLVR